MLCMCKKYKEAIENNPSGGHLMGYISTLVWEIVKGYTHVNEYLYGYKKELQKYNNSMYNANYKNWEFIQGGKGYKTCSFIRSVWMIP